MGAVSTVVRLTAEVRVSLQTFVSEREPVGWVDVDELGVYGPPVELRRVAGALIEAADQADRLLAPAPMRGQLALVGDSGELGDTTA